MAKLKSKGTVFQQSISSVYTAFPQIISISVSGEAAETFDSTTLDGSVYKTHDPTGYTETATISWEYFYDPDNAVHTAFAALLSTPAANNFKLIYTDSTPTEVIYSGVGATLDKTIAANDGVKASASVKTSGAPS